MPKIAKLVCVSLMTRVIVDTDATESQILLKARGQFIDKIADDLADNIESIEDDEESPYDPKFDGADLPKITVKYNDAIENARDLLCDNDDLSKDGVTSIEMQVERIVAQAKIDGTTMIDYVDEVIVWEKVELEFTCDQFLDEINYPRDFVKS